MQGVKRRIRPSQEAGRSGWRCQFRHPLRENRVVSARLPDDELLAKRVCHELELLCADATLWDDPRSPRLAVYHALALVIFFGRDSVPAARRESPEAHAFDGDEGDQVKLSLATGLEELEYLKRTPQQLADWIMGFYVELELRKNRELSEQVSNQENKIKALEPENDYLRADNARLQRKYNVNVKATLGEAREKWKLDYTGRSPSTVQQATGALDSFVASLPTGECFKLGEVEARHVNEWLRGLKRTKLRKGKPDARPLTPPTKRKLRVYVAGFFNWARGEYGLAQNPVEASTPVGGLARHPEQIVAIRRLGDIETLLDKLKPLPYWHAWTATAILAGLRWSEMAHLRLDDVFLENGYLRVSTRAPGPGGPRGERKGTKTGRERSVPIERTVLASILAEHVKTRKRERRTTGAAAALRTAYLFPSTLDDNPYSPRRKSPPGVWAGNRNCRDAWDAARAKVQGQRPAYFWKLWGHDWRHTAGCVMGHSGISTLRISQWLGCDEDVARRHYIPPIGAERWPYKWD